MADPSLDDIGQWILNNKDKAGTPDFVKMSDAYRQLSQPTASPDAAPDSAPAAPSLWQRTKDYLVPPVPPGLGPHPDIADVRRAQDPNPYSASNRADRIFTSMLTATPDTGIAVYNAAARAVGKPEAQADYLAPQMRATAGVAELPADASAVNRYGEGLVTGVLGGGGWRRALIPTVAGMVGSGVGEAVGGETGALLGGLVGSQTPRAAANAGRAAIRQSYSDSGRPDAPAIAQASDWARITPTPGMLGNRSVQDLEASLQRKPGSGPTIEAARDQARQQMVDAVNRVADANGATMSNPNVIGGVAARTATESIDNLATRSSAGQQHMIDQIGPRTPADVANVLAQMEDIRHRTDPLTYAPIEARVGALRQMLPRDPEGNIASTEIPVERLKDWRTGLRVRSQGYDPVPSRYAGQIYDEATSSYRDAAQGAGVPPDQFASVQGRTSALERPGGYRENLSEVGDRDPKAAYTYLLRGGEQDPQRLTNFSQGVRAASGAAGDARTADIFGSHLRRILDETLSKREGYAPGPINYAERINTMNPASLRQIAGGVPQAQTLRDVATAARAFHRPTQQGGASKAGADVVGAATDKLASGAIGSMAATSLGLPPWLGAGLSYLGPRQINNARASILMSPSARAGILNQPTPFRPAVSVDALKAALSAIQGMQSY